MSELSYSCLHDKTDTSFEHNSFQSCHSTICYYFSGPPHPPGEWSEFDCSSHEKERNRAWTFGWIKERGNQVGRGESFNFAAENLLGFLIQPLHQIRKIFVNLVETIPIKRCTKVSSKCSARSSNSMKNVTFLYLLLRRNSSPLTHALLSCSYSLCFCGHQHQHHDQHRHRRRHKRILPGFHHWAVER